LPFETRSAMGLYTAAERARALETGEYTQDVAAVTETLSQSAAPAAPVAPAAKVQDVKIEEAPRTYNSSTELMEAITGVASDAPLCMTCGVKMRASGACYVCEGCGNTSGCS
jgi:ribonucleoside-diphosphate reductase alpha chain